MECQGSGFHPILVGLLFPESYYLLLLKKKKCQNELSFSLGFSKVEQTLFARRCSEVVLNQPRRGYVS